MEDAASVATLLVEGSNLLGTFPGSLELAFSPLSHSSDVGGASLSLSHPDLDDSTLGSCSGNASSESSSSVSVLGASPVALVPSLENLGSLHVESSSDDTSSESSLSLSVGSAVSSSLVFESSNNSSSSSSSDASSPGSVSLLGNSAVHTSLVLVLSDDLLASDGTDLSLGLGILVDDTVLSSRSESLGNSGSLHDSSPCASLESNISSSQDLAALETSFEGSDNLSGSSLGGTGVDSASSDGLVASLEDSASSLSLRELLDLLGSLDLH